MFLTEQEDIDNYYKTDLCYKTYLFGMAQLEAIKRDHFEPITLELWYREFIRMGWTQAKFSEQLMKVARGKKYGKVDFNDFLEGQRTFTEDEFNERIAYTLQHMRQQGACYLTLWQEGFALTDKELQSAAFYAAEQLKTAYDVERRNLFDDAIEAEKKRLAEQTAEKKKLIKKLSPVQKFYLVNQCMVDGILPDDKSTATRAAYHGHTAMFADMIPMEYIIKAKETAYGNE